MLGTVKDGLGYRAKECHSVIPKRFAATLLFSSANSSMPTQFSIPLKTAHKTIITISMSLWGLFWFFRRGSVRAAKHVGGGGSGSTGVLGKIAI